MKSLVFLLLAALPGQAAVLSLTGVEVKFSYIAEFQTTDTSDVTALADAHAQHLFGYLQSPSVVANYGIHPETPGAGSPRLPLSYEILKEKKHDGVRTIAYKVSGYFLLNKKMAKRVLAKGSWTITLPYDLDNFYEKKCTDEHYSGYGDFWYFYDPFREGCSLLRESPLASPIVIKITALKSYLQDAPTNFDKIRGNNGNGDLLQITTINGFAEDAYNPEDDGRLSFELVNQWLRDEGFHESIVAGYMNRPIHQFEKSIPRKEGKPLQVRITRLLAETAILKKNVTFAKFFKQAAKEADVVIYAGHSGLGGNLDIASLEEKAGPLEFTPHKHQIFFFDGCSTYAYYLSMFEAQKSKGKLDILTNGLTSYFGYEGPQHIQLLENILKVQNNPTWREVLKDMENTLDGVTFLLNVGSL